jgi:hypothetical protein
MTFNFDCFLELFPNDYRPDCQLARNPDDVSLLIPRSSCDQPILARVHTTQILLVLDQRMIRILHLTLWRGI